MRGDRVVALALALLAATLVSGGCGGQGASPVAPAMTATRTPSPVPLSSTITAQDAFSLVESNRKNPDFVILDVRTAAEFGSGRIAGAINIDYYSPDFRSIVSVLNANRRYLVYCQSGVRSAAATQIMVDLGFTQVQNLTGGLDQWIQDGYPTVPLPRTITAQDAFSLVESNRNNPDFVILDVRTAAEFASGHIAAAINIDYYSPDFRSMVSVLNANRRYLVYCRSGVRGVAATQIMVDLGFMQVQNLTGGLDQWIQDGYPTVTSGQGDQQSIMFVFSDGRGLVT